MPLSVDSVPFGDAILFLGAGFSKGAANINDEPIKAGWQFADHLLDKCGITDKEGYDLDTAAEEYSLQFTKNALVKELSNSFRSSTVTNEQRIIVTQPWLRIYTTNYDDIIHRICLEERKRYTLKSVSDSVSAPNPSETQLIHIYGSILQSSPDEFCRNFLLTESQRDNSFFLKSPWYWRFCDDCLSVSGIYFVGYSMNDIDIRRLLGMLPEHVKQKTFFIDREGAKRPTVLRQERFGAVHLVGTKGFAAALGEKRLTRTERSLSPIPQCFHEMRFEHKSDVEISGSDIEYLLVAGALNTDLLSQKDIDGSSGSYTIKRSDRGLKRASEPIKGRPVLVHSDIGNGKSVFLYHVAYLHSLKGRSVYALRGEPEDPSELIRFCQTHPKEFAVIADDIAKYRYSLKHIIDVERDDIYVLTSARSNFFEAGRAIIDKRLSNHGFIEVDLNLNDQSVINRIVHYLDENALWGEYAEFNIREKRRFISSTCGGQLRDVILSLFENGALHEKVVDLVNSVRQLPGNIYDLTIFSAILTVEGFSEYGRLHIAADLSGYDGSFEDIKGAYGRHGLLGIIQLDGGEILFKSPALAEFIVRNAAGLDRVLGIVKGALVSLDSYYSDDETFDPLIRNLLKVSFYAKLFRGSEVDSHLDSFYDSCRTLGIAQRDPLFHVQRSITNMNRRQFSVSQKYVETAYGMAKNKRNYDPYQIDTHYAKLILTRSMTHGVSENCSAEIEAQDLLEGVLDRRPDDLYHPLSVMRLYSEITLKWTDYLNEAQRESLKSLVDRAMFRLQKFPDHMQPRFKGFRQLKRGLETARSRLA